jgi:regulator of protease activity HflC (stomatin/prohibitin superfamily)
MPWYDQSKPDHREPAPPPARPRGGRRPWLATAATASLFCLWVVSGLQVVPPGAGWPAEAGGLHYHLPAPFPGAGPEPPAALKQLDLNTGALPAADAVPVDLHLAVRWRIADAGKAGLSDRPPEAAVATAAVGAARRAVALSPAAALASDRTSLQASMRAQAQQALDRQGAGVQVVEVQVDPAMPPAGK